MKKRVANWGINDADYVVSWFIYNEGKRVQKRCPFYTKWSSMINRCHHEGSIQHRETYEQVSVCEEWRHFSNFKAWMETQDWEGKQLDKDILVPDAKIYSPETCVFVDGYINTFVLDNRKRKGNLMTGVHWCNTRKKLVSQCHNPFNGKREFLGFFEDELEAHLAWKRRKHQFACQIADLQKDPRIIHALKTRYL